MRTCEFCGKALPPPVRTSGRPRRFCNRACSDSAWRGRSLRPKPSECRGCGAHIEQGPRTRNPRKWCNLACRARTLSRESGNWTRDQAEPRKCKGCPASFAPQIPQQAYCSAQCGWLHRAELRRKPPRVVRCLECSTPVRTNAPRSYCPTCRVRRERELNRDRTRRKHYRRRGARAGEPYTLQQIGNRDQWHCHLCARPVDRSLSGRHPNGPTIDHFIPISKGGLDTFTNVFLAHRSCNTSRGATLPTWAKATTDVDGTPITVSPDGSVWRTLPLKCREAV